MSTFIKNIHRHFPVTLLLLLLATPAAWAQPEFIGGDLGIAENDGKESNSMLESSESAAPAPNYSPADAADKVRAKVGGQIINVSTRHHDNGVIYNVKVLNSGRMKIIYVDGQTGQLLNK